MVSKDLLTCVRRKEAAGGADALTQSIHFRLGRRVQRHRQEVVEVDGMSLTLDQAGQAAARWLQVLLLQDLADAGVHACVQTRKHTFHIQKSSLQILDRKPSTNFCDTTHSTSNPPKSETRGRGGGPGGE